MQYVYLCNLLTAIFFAPLVISQFIDTREEVVYFRDKLCGYMWPC